MDFLLIFVRFLIERTIPCYEPSFFLSEFLFFVQTIIFLKIATEIVAVAVVNEMAAAAAQGLGFLISYFHLIIDNLINSFTHNNSKFYNI